MRMIIEIDRALNEVEDCIVLGSLRDLDPVYQGYSEISGITKVEIDSGLTRHDLDDLIEDHETGLHILAYYPKHRP
jgi:hypothetical protein